MATGKKDFKMSHCSANFLIWALMYIEMDRLFPLGRVKILNGISLRQRATPESFIPKLLDRKHSSLSFGCSDNVLTIIGLSSKVSFAKKPSKSLC